MARVLLSLERWLESLHTGKEGSDLRTILPTIAWRQSGSIGGSQWQKEGIQEEAVKSTVKFFLHEENIAWQTRKNLWREKP